MAEQQILFLIGAGRSGTTALAELLNAHPAICIGIERYKLRFLRHGVFSGSEFTRRRFFHFRAPDTNILPSISGKWRALYADMAPKYARARIVGDKIPHLYEKFDECAAAFADAKWIYMLRKVDAVASSWNARAHSASDKWSSQNDYRRAVPVWNAANATIMTRLDPQKVHVVCYEDFFSGNPIPYRALLRFLGVGEPPAFKARVADAFRHYGETILRKTPLVLEGQPEFIAQTADFETYRDLLRASGQAA